MSKQHWVNWLLLNNRILKSITTKKKKIGACVFWAPVFFLSFLAGKMKSLKQMLVTELAWKLTKNWHMRFFGGQKKRRVEKQHWVTKQLILKSNRLMAEEVLEKRTKHFATVFFLLNLPKLSFGKIHFLPLLSTRLLAVRSSSPVVSAWFELQLSTIQLSAMVKETIKLTNTSTITSWKSNKII